MNVVFDLKGVDLPLAGYTLILRAPTLHQHKALLEAMKALQFGPVLDVIKPALDGIRSGEKDAFVGKVLEAIPALITTLRDGVLSAGMEAMVDAAAVCLDTRANHRRLSAAPPDADFDPAIVGDFDTGPDGSTYLQCARLRAFVAANITVDAAFWILSQALALGSYTDMGKALARTVMTAFGGASALVPPQATTAVPITA